MKIVCYAFKNKKGELEAPFLEYLEKYAVQDRDSVKKRNLKIKRATNVYEHLKYLITSKGKWNQSAIIQKYKNRNIGILKIKESTQLVRIAFFIKTGNKIILLNAMDKPKLYEKGRKIKVDKMIEKFLEKSESYKQDYFKKNISLTLTL